MVVISYQCHDCNTFYHFEIKDGIFTCVNYNLTNKLEVTEYKYNEVFPKTNTLNSLFLCPNCKKQQAFIISNINS